jgi:hypothetical protein
MCVRITIQTFAPGDFYEIQHANCGTSGNPTAVTINFQHSVTTTWRTREIVRWEPQEDHWNYYLRLGSDMMHFTRILTLLGQIGKFCNVIFIVLYKLI